MFPSLTLRRLLALPEHPAPLHDSILIMIDCQNTYRRGVMHLDGVEPALAEAARLLARARAAHTPVIHIMHDAGPGSPYDTTTDIGRISDEVSPAPGEPVIVKKYPSAFFQTSLDSHLRMLERTDLVLAGFMTHMCVNSTARDAFNLGYKPTVVSAATATRSLPGTDGHPISAPLLQSASLATLADLFALVVGKSDDIPD
jgi:nicotinamidase-related amidase